ncbi:hypothetical protein CsSME_00001166 [Camellia sinensis var. sinensis]
MQVGEELSSLRKISCPIVITSLLFYSKSVISMFFLGQLGDNELAAGSLSIAFANITGYSVLMEQRSGQFLVKPIEGLSVSSYSLPFQSLYYG